MSVLMPLLHSPRPDRASTAWHCPGSPRPRLPPGSGTLRPGQPGRPWRVWPGRTGPSHPVGRLPAPPPPPGTTDSPTHDSTPDPEPPPKPTHQPPHHDAHPDQTNPQTHNTPPRVVHHHQNPPLIGVKVSTLRTALTPPTAPPRGRNGRDQCRRTKRTRASVRPTAYAPGEVPDPPAGQPPPLPRSARARSPAPENPHLSGGTSGRHWAASAGSLRASRRSPGQSLCGSRTYCPACGVCVTTTLLRCPNGVRDH